MEQEFTIHGIIFMSLGWGFCFALAGYCFYKVLTIKPTSEPEDEEK